MSWERDALERLTTTFEGHRDPGRARGMVRYMRDQFPFLGVPTPERRALQREALSGQGPPDEAALLAAAALLWDLPEREYQYIAADLLSRHERNLTPDALPALKTLITTKSWWDTVDALAGPVGSIVLRHREMASLMDEWIESENTWLARTAILHQLRYKAATDRERLFAYCALRADSKEFFLRKAIGWALREYSKTNPEAVLTFVQEHDAELSPLSKREALLRITRAALPAGRA